MDTCSGSFHLCVMTVPMYLVTKTLAEEIRGFGPVARAPRPTVNPLAWPAESRRPTKAIATATFNINWHEFDMKKHVERAEELSQFLVLTKESAHVRANCGVNKKCCKKKFLQRQVKTAICKSKN